MTFATLTLSSLYICGGGAPDGAPPRGDVSVHRLGVRTVNSAAAA